MPTSITTTSAEEKQVLRYDNILVSPRGITEVHGTKIVLFVPSSDIDHIILKFGRSEHRPIVSISIGLIFAAVGIYGLVYFILSPRGYRFEIGMMLLGLIGGSIIFDALKKRYFLETYKGRGISRLVFSKNAQLKDIQDFCRKVSEAYKYQITDRT